MRATVSLFAVGCTTEPSKNGNYVYHFLLGVPGAKSDDCLSDVELIPYYTDKKIPMKFMQKFSADLKQSQGQKGTFNTIYSLNPVAEK